MTVLRRSVLLALIAASSAAAANPLVPLDDLRKLGYFQYWEMSLSFEGAQHVTHGFLVDDSIYLTTDTGMVHSIHAGVGLPRWSQLIAGKAQDVFCPTHFYDANGHPFAVCATPSRTVIVDRLMGDLIADMPIKKATTCPPVADATRIYFGSADGYFYSMIWNDPRTVSAIEFWKVIAGGPTTSRPYLINENNDLVFASQGGYVFNCTAVGKILNWRFEAEGPIFGDIAVVDSGTYVASIDRSLYRISTDSGLRRWRVRFPQPLDRGPLVAGRTVYQYCTGEGITALNADDGDTLWQVRDAVDVAAVAIDHVFLIGADESVLKVRMNDGQVVARVAMPRDVVPLRNIDGDTLYFASVDGDALCAQPVGKPHLTPEELAVARRAMRKARTDRDDTGADQPEFDQPARDRGGIDPKDPLRDDGGVPPLGGSRPN